MSAAEKAHPELAHDTRTWPRASAYVGISVYSDHNFYTGFSLNLSEGGVFVATHNLVPVGSTVVLHMILPFDDVPVVTMAEVRWYRDYSEESDGPPGMGLKFVDIDPSSLEVVKRFVSTVREPLFFDE
jgi:uncharacterized protein (TIGR02266 family)